MEWIHKMGQFTLMNMKGAGSTQEYRCTPDKISAFVNAAVPLYGIHESTALKAIAEMVRRGGAFYSRVIYN